MQEVGGSIPPSSTRFSLEESGQEIRAPEQNMHQAGRIGIYIGIGLVAVGLIVGFGAMFMDYDDQAKMFIGLVPIGFVLLLAGTVATQLTPPKDKQ